MTNDTAKKDVKSDVDDAIETFATADMSERETGRILTEVAAFAADAQADVLEDALPSIDEALAVAEALIDENVHESAQSTNESRLMETRALLEELDDEKGE